MDHEVLAFGEKALQNTYYGALLVFDLAGMKRLNRIAAAGEEAEIAVNNFLSRIESDLSHLIQRDQVTFRYKSNGDEFIFAIRAKDEVEACTLTQELGQRWVESGWRLMREWKKDLFNSLHGTLEHGFLEKAVRFDMHVLVCSMNDMKITIKGGIDRPDASPDFISSRFTKLTAAFKDSRYGRIAMYRDDADRMMGEGREWAFEPFGDDQVEMGWLSWRQVKNEESAA